MEEIKLVAFDLDGTLLDANIVLKEKCDKIICSNNEHVVDYILKNYVISD